MSNRILQVQVRDHSLDPAQAEVWISVLAEHVTPTTELRGRLTGPRCHYAATVEVAYAFRPLLRRPEGLPDLTMRAVIPEPSLWEPACPFVYQGVVELWEDGLRCDQVQLRHGLRRVVLGPAGLRVNGAPLLLRGRMTMECDEARSASLRAGGCNLLLTPAETALWDLADVQGFFVLGRMSDVEDAFLQRAVARSDHPSCLGWLFPEPRGERHTAAIQRLHGRGLVGVELHAAASTPLPRGVDFIACPSDLAVELHRIGLPLLLFGGGSGSTGVFGTVE